MGNDKDRQNELDCLNKIKNSFINSKGIKKEFDNSDYLTMKSILSSAYQNENHNDFPDFFFDDGIMEHFEVFASKDAKNGGSRYKEYESKIKRENEEHFKQFKKECFKNPYCPEAFYVEQKNDTYVESSYVYFVESFKKNIEHHLKSLRNSIYTNSVVIFLIEQQASRLCVYTNNTFNRFYKLSEDKKLLQYIKETGYDVNYIIFNATDSYEIIDMSKIDLVITQAKENLDIRGGRQINCFVNWQIDL